MKTRPWLTWLAAGLSLSAGGLAWWWSAGRSAGSGCPTVGDAVVERARAVTPSTYGDGSDPVSQTWLRGMWTPSTPGTSCGIYVGYALSPWVDTRSGTEYVRTAARARGAWVDWAPGLTPCPGAAYGLEDPANPGLVHVGIVVSLDGTTLTTLDGGQGGHDDTQGAAEVRRTFDPETGDVTYLGKTRRLAGWFDPAGYETS